MSDANLKTLLNGMKDYIESVEVKIDGEWGECRSLEELIRDGQMPLLYGEILEEIRDQS